MAGLNQLMGPNPCNAENGTNPNFNLVGVITYSDSAILGLSVYYLINASFFRLTFVRMKDILSDFQDVYRTKSSTGQAVVTYSDTRHW